MLIKLFWCVCLALGGSFFPLKVLLAEEKVSSAPIYIDIANKTIPRGEIALPYSPELSPSTFFSGGVSSQGVSAEVGISLAGTIALVGSANWFGYGAPVVIDLSFFSDLGIKSVVLDRLTEQIGTLTTQLGDIQQALSSLSTTINTVIPKITTFNNNVASINASLTIYNTNVAQDAQIELLQKVDIDNIVLPSTQELEKVVDFLATIEESAIKIGQELIIESVSAGAFLELSPRVFGRQGIFNGFFFKGGFFWVSSDSHFVLSVPNSVLRTLLSAVSLSSADEVKKAKITTLIGSSDDALDADPNASLSMIGRISYQDQQKYFPYLGVGYRTPNPGFGLVFDLGVMIGNGPNLAFTCMCTPAQESALELAQIDVPALVNDFLPSSVKHVMGFWPYVRLGIQYRF